VSECASLATGVPVWVVVAGGVVGFDMSSSLVRWMDAATGGRTSCGHDEHRPGRAVGAQGAWRADAAG